MIVPDWHAHAQQVELLAPAPSSPPSLSLLPPLTDLVVADAETTSEPEPEPELHDSTDTALGARVAEELAVLTRVLLGPGRTERTDVTDLAVHAPEPEVLEVLEVTPVAPPVVEAFDEPFVAPPVVEVVPLVAVVEPVPPRPGAGILEELAFLDG